MDSEIQKREDAAESALVQDTAKKLAEQFDAVVILCTRHEGSRGTRTISKGAGNWHAQYGLVKEWLEDYEEKMRIDTRRTVAEEAE